MNNYIIYCENIYRKCLLFNKREKCDYEFIKCFNRKLI